MIHWFVTIVLIFIIIKIYFKLTTGWCYSYVCLAGKTVIVTGANTGIGYYTALDFAKRGARVILACRNENKANEACKKIIEDTGNQNVVVRLVDFTSLESVSKFAKKINETEERLDILVNNAGAGGVENKTTKDGLQILMQVNYFSSFLLTHLLIGLLKKSAPSRIVNVSSVMAILGKINLDNLNQYTGLYSNYSDSKLCNILFTKELARKLEKTGVTSYSLHPGSVKTDIFRRFQGILKLVSSIFINTIFKTSEEGAQTTIYVAITKDIEHLNGEHFVDCQHVKPYYNTKDMGLAKKLWEKTEEIIQDKVKDKIPG